ncbi:1-deoxy-D-xylulose-5-phosphate reductoisomerase [Helicobacter burdigaliensis]|uniref:1-deoxy-D-xylulose-5-phosphate reductoisomerase n=1 Tax=Helicobacter burdigaliensis TaxID=2315334 RepID=UPI000EF6D08A|nr:1-deoxy-D-xylulose-5-phosphate reductoisomerase [Helicobacter burdigaliensis]
MVLLGASGSIGINTLKIAKRFNLKIETLGVGYNIKLLNEQISAFNPQNIIIADKNDKDKITKDYKGRIFFGASGIKEALEISKSKLVVNALVGFLGLEPTLNALKLNKKVALANKESLVVGGSLVDTKNIIPIDSEHFSLSYLLTPTPFCPFKNLYITASGGAFRDFEISKIPNQKAKTALKHPNWKMGNKITIDSASMVNKLFEILEAFWLFKSKNIHAFIERNSHIHALVEFYDGSLVAHFANADMQLPIAYALSLGLEQNFLENLQAPLIPPLKITDSSYKLEEISKERYPLWELKNILLEKPQYGAILNASNEIAVAAFLEDKILFGKIGKIIFKALEKFENANFNTFSELLELDKEVRAFSSSLL